MTAISRRLVCALAMVCMTVLLPLGALAPQPVDAKPAATAKKAKKAKKKRKAAKKKSTKRSAPAPAAAEKGPKGDKGDKGDQGPAGPAGPAGGSTSAIVAKVRLGKPTSTGDSDDGAAVPLTGNTWTSAADQADDLAGEVTLKVPPKCEGETYAAEPDPTDPRSILPPPIGYEPHEHPGWVAIDLFLGDRFVGGAFSFYDASKAGKTTTLSINADRLVNGDSPTPRTLTARAFDGCANPGESFEVADVRVNVYALR